MMASSRKSANNVVMDVRSDVAHGLRRRCRAIFLVSSDPPWRFAPPSSSSVPAGCSTLWSCDWRFHVAEVLARGVETGLWPFLLHVAVSPGMLTLRFCPSATEFEACTSGVVTGTRRSASSLVGEPEGRLGIGRGGAWGHKRGRGGSTVSLKKSGYRISRGWHVGVRDRAAKAWVRQGFGRRMGTSVKWRRDSSNKVDIRVRVEVIPSERVTIVVVSQQAREQWRA